MLNAPMLGNGKTGRHIVISPEMFAQVYMSETRGGSDSYGEGGVSSPQVFGFEGNFAGGNFLDGGTTNANLPEAKGSANVLMVMGDSPRGPDGSVLPLYIGCVENQKVMKFEVADEEYQYVSRRTTPLLPTMVGNFHLVFSVVPFTSFSIQGMWLPKGGETCVVLPVGDDYAASFFLQTAVSLDMIDFSSFARKWYYVTYGLQSSFGGMFFADYAGEDFFGIVLMPESMLQDGVPAMMYYCAETGATMSMQGTVSPQPAQAGKKFVAYKPDLARKTSQYAPFPLAKYAKAHITFTDNLVFE